MSLVVCAGGCGARVDVARTDNVPRWLGACFAFLNYFDMRAGGWSFETAGWTCVHCLRRRRLIHILKSDATPPPPPTERKK